MPPKRILWILVLASLGLVIKAEATGPRTLHRLVGGHFSLKPNSDDTELIITSSAGGGRESKQKKGGEDEEKKTLSQQVADGKYGLIQKELFSKPIKKPGVISYESNPEVPKDTIDNLGGLNQNDIWLAENHLLVIKGGSFPDHEAPLDNLHSQWIPIDDYKAPSRQVKIPANPKVPPPFPVQLTEGGPLQILGTNSSTTLNGTFSAEPYPISSPEGYFPAFPPGNPYSSNFTSGETPFPIPPYPPAGDYGPPFPPFPINGSLPPFFASLPPGAAILPPPGNFTDYDEDDPSIYYPPPYSFYYQMDNSTDVPPGPLVPGIVLPPPPNFFAPLEKQRKKPSLRITTKKPTTTQKTTTTFRTTQRPTTHRRITQRPTIHRPTTTTEIVKQIHGTTTPIPPTPFNKPSRMKPMYIERPTTQPPIVVTILPTRQHNRTSPPLPTTPRPYIPERRKKPPAVTVLRPVKPSTTTTTPRPVYFYENNEVNEKPFKVYGNPPPQRTVISSTQIPLKSYYSTSEEIDSNSVTQNPVGKYYRGGISTLQSPKTTKAPTQFYFYEEAVTNSITTQRAPIQKPNDPGYYNIPNDYYLPAKQNVRAQYQENKPNQQGPPQYYYVTNRPSRPSRYRFVETTKKPDTFSVHVARLKQQIHQYYTTPDPYGQSYQQRPQSSSKPVYQFSFQAANYQQQNPQFRPSPVDGNNEDKFRPNKYSVEIQPAIEVTEPPIYQNTPSPKYQNYQNLPPQNYQNQQPQLYQDPPVSNYRNVAQQNYQNTNYQNPRPVYSNVPAGYINQQQYQNSRPQSYQNNPAAYQNPQPYTNTQSPIYHNTPSPIYYQQKVTTKRPKYQSSPRPDYEYEEVDDNNNNKNRYVATPKPVSQYQYEATPNPVYQQYYTKQEDNYFDDMTKKYFTVFGKKLPEGTTPINNIEATTASPRRPIYSDPKQNVQIEYAQSIGKEISLEGDTLVNYVRGRPRPNSQSEYIGNRPRQRYPNRYVQQDASLESDINVNYKQPRPPVNSEAEIVEAIPVKISGSPEGKSGSYISYELPGDDGAHFYFLTPQLAQSRDQGAGYYYSNPDASERIRRSQKD